MRRFKEQWTFRAVITGCIGCVIITMSSLYVALKLGALPFPIIFTALVSLFCLKALGGSNINEVNVTHTIMSAGAMTAGGLAFTVPGVFMLNPHVRIEPLTLLCVILGGVAAGLIFTGLFRSSFIDRQNLPYPMGQAAAETVKAGDEGGAKSRVLFGSFGAAGLWTFLRDGWTVITGRTLIPAALLNNTAALWGSQAGIWLSPMLISVGYIIGPLVIGVWFAGALLGDGVILAGGQAAGFFDKETALAVKSSLGIGLMVGSGAGIIFRGIAPRLRERAASTAERRRASGNKRPLCGAALALALLAAMLTGVCGLGLVPSLIVIAGAAITTAMSAQITGQTGINPMEVFGIIIVLAARAAAPLDDMRAFFAAAVIAIACGLTGDIMNDFKSGAILDTNPRAQWLGECAGGIVGAFTALGTFYVLLSAYGPASFGTNGLFPAPQAGAVAAMVGGIPHTAAFIAGLAAGCLLYSAGLPVMTAGLGVYLPFYLSATVFLGVILRWIVVKAAPRFHTRGTDTIIASGLMGGEAVAGVIIAIGLALGGALELSR